MPRLPQPRPAPLGVALLLFASGCVDDVGPQVREISEVRRVTGDARPTAATYDRAEARRLPEVWPARDRQRVRSAWYRAWLDLEDAPSEPWALYVPRFSQSVEARVNGQWVGSSGRIEPPLSRNWNRPLLLRLPTDLLRAGENSIELHLALQATAPGFLHPAYVGPERELAQAFRRRFFVQVTCARYGAVLMAASALILGYIAFRREQFRPFRFFAAGSVLWAIASAELFVQDPPLTARWWQLATMASIASSLVLFTQATHRTFERNRRRLELALYAAVGALVLGLASVPDAFFEALALLLWAFCAGVGIYLAVIFVFARRPPMPRGRALVLLGAVALLIGAHDVLLGLGFAAPPSFFLAPALSLITAFWAAWVVVDHFLSALREAETLNRELEERVAAKHAELESNFERLRQLERQRAVGAERERLMREMHDGMGGQLVSALAMAEDEDTSSAEIATVLRAALDDMRLVIDSLDPVIDDLPTLLGMIRGRVEPRLRAHDLRFDWRVTDLPPLADFGPEQFLHILRIVQEAITNVVKHAAARVIRVETTESSGPGDRPGIRLRIADDGRGCGAGREAIAGRGVQNMRARAKRLGGRIEIRSAPDAGTVVDLWIPLGKPPPEPEAKRSQ